MTDTPALELDPLPYYCVGGDHRCPSRLVEATSGQGYAAHSAPHQWVWAPRETWEYGVCS